MIILTFYLKKLLKEKKKKDGMAKEDNGKIFHKDKDMKSKMISPILTGASVLVLYSAVVLLEKETLPDLFCLQNITAVNNANKMPTQKRIEWK